MVTIRHKQTNKIETIGIQVWLSRYVHELWDVIEIKDVVNLEMLQNDKWRHHNIVELSDALQIIEQNPNIFKYTDSNLNQTKGIKSSRRQPKIVPSSSPVPDEFVKIINNRLKTEAPIQSSRNLNLYNLLESAKNTGFISLTKDDANEFHEYVNYALERNWIKQHSKGSYKLAANGYDILEAGSIAEWQRLNAQKQQASTQPAQNVYNAPVFHNSTLADSDFSKQKTVNNSTIHNSTSSQKKWYEKTQTIISIIAGIISMITFYILLKTRGII